MGVDYLDAASGLVLIVTLMILVFALYRATEFNRVLVGGAYKSRAKWTAVFLASVAFLLVDSSGQIPYLSADNETTGFLLITLALPLFINGNVRAAQETDFFHRDILYWRVLWRANIVGLLCVTILTVVVILLSGYVPGTSSTASPSVSAGASLFFFILIVESIYGTATLIVAARRSQDRTMRRFVRMLGLSLLGLVLFFTVWIPIDYFAPGVGDFLSYFGFVMAAYYLYKAVMSLSPLSKFETKVAADASLELAGRPTLPAISSTDG